MKWNWGKGIVLGMLLFISFIMYMVITMSTDTSYSHDLVTDEYYAKEMVYQTEIDAETNTNNLSEAFQGEKTNEGWLITFPKEIKASKVKGNVALYRPSNQKLDFDFPLVLSGSNLLIPKKQLIEGRWNITIDFNQDNTNYMYKQSITY